MSKGEGLIIDANLLLLLVIGAVESGRYIRHSKRLKDFGVEDYDNVLKLIKPYKEIFITPYLATEVSNLIDLNGEARQLAFEIARILFSSFKQIDVKINQDCESKFFLQFGITDNSLINLASNYVILTNDHRLTAPLKKNNAKKSFLIFWHEK